MGCLDEGRPDDIASLVALKPLLDDDGQPYLPLMYTFSFGQELSVNQDSVLVRPFHKALKDGQPVGTIGYVFYKEENKYYVLGSFAHSPGGKVIFFPGIVDSRLVKTADEGEILYGSPGLSYYVQRV